MEENENGESPGYYAVIPATVRYDKNVPHGARLLYGEITALCNKKGYCWARNAYFADLYQTSERTVINWINSLKKYGYISVHFIYKTGKKVIQSRIIKIPKPFFPPEKGENEKGEKDVSEGGSGGEVVKYSSPRGENNFTTYGKNFQEVVKNPSKGGEKNFTDNITNNNKDTTTTAASQNQPFFDSEAPPEGGVAAEALSPEIIKKAILEIDRTVLLKADFYPRAAAFMSLQHLNKSYLAWLYKQVELRNPENFDGLFFTLFFAENMVEKYRVSKLPEEKPPPLPQPVVSCPVCGSVHDADDEKCPECSLPHNPLPDQIALFKNLYYSLPPDKRDEYLRKEDAIYSSFNGDLKKLNEMKNALNREYDIGVEHEEPSRSYHP